MTDAMIEKARENARAGGYTNVEFRKGDAEALPVSDASVDWIISNCVINLAPDKAAVFSEIARVLRPGGRFSISDLVTAGPLPPQLAANMAAWAGCVAGAIPEAEYLEGLRQAGLADVEVAGRIVYDEATVGEFLESYGGGTQCGCTAGAVTGKVWSARITGRKPAL